MPTSPPDAIAVRDAHADDIDALVELLGAFFAEDATAKPAMFATASEPELRDYWTEVLASSEQRVFVATLGGQVAGVLTLEEVRRRAELGRHPAAHAFIHFLAVGVGHRRKGVATRLLHHAHQWSAGNGFHSVRLHVWEINDAARRLYERVGYTTQSRTLAIDV